MKEKCFVPLAVEPLLVDAQRLAVILSVSTGHIHAQDNAGKLPQARKLGTRKLWSVEEIREWVRSGCPVRTDWEREKLLAGK